jgi:hypothetical protein
MITKQPAGLYIESYVKDMFEDIYDSAYVESTEEEDLFSGTDCFIGGVPIDITINPNKNYSKFIKQYVLEGVTVNVLSRYRNSHHKFERPVLVFHFDVYDLRDRMIICELIEENLTKDIVSEMLGLYK